MKVLREELPGTLNSNAGLGLALGRGERLGAYQGPDGALVELPGGPEGGGLVVAESTTPLRSSEGSGKLEPVDLSLEDRGRALTPENPIVPMAISKDVKEGVLLPDAGIRIRAADSTEQVTVAGVRVFFANAEDGQTAGSDADLVVGPERAGVSFGWQLRSEASPEEARLAFELPPGASLKTDNQAGKRGATVVKDGKPLAVIEPAAAFDADGLSVPASYAVEGDVLVVRFPHRDGDWKYPLYVDPVVDVIDQYALGPDGNSSGFCDFVRNRPYNWYEDSTQGAGTLYGTSSTQESYRNSKWWFWKDSSQGYCGLWLQPTRDGGAYARNEYAQWVHGTPPGRNATIRRAQFRAAQVEGYSCVYEGIFSTSLGRYEDGRWDHPAQYGNDSGPSPWIYDQQTWALQDPDRQPYVGRSNSCVSFSDNSKAHYGESTPNNLAVFGIQMQGNPTTRTPNVRLWGSLLYLDDFDTPTTTLAHQNLPAGWVHKASPTVTASASENQQNPGLGVRWFNFYIAAEPGSGNYQDPGTGGTYAVENADYGCSGTRFGRCPASWSKAKAYNTDGSPEGVVRNYVIGYDALGKESPQAAWDVKVDRSAPTAPLGGSLYADRNSFIAANNQTLTVNASDRKGAIGVSGIKNVSYKITRTDTGEVVRSGSEENSSCHPQNGCSPDFTRQFNVDFTGLPSAKYDVAVTTKDQLGDDATYGSSHRRVQTFAVELDRAPPEVTSVTTTPNRWLKGGERAETTVAARDDRSGVKSFDLAFPAGPPAATVSRNCGGLVVGKSPPRCATSDSVIFAYDITGDRFPSDGLNAVRATVKDATGQQSPPREGQLKVDRGEPDVEVSGGLRSLNPTGRDLHVKATDGSAGAPRSGVASIRLVIDRNGDGAYGTDEEEASAEQTCPPSSDSCPLDLDYALPVGYPEGQHKAKVTVLDRAGNLFVEEWTFYVVDLFPGNRSRLGLEDWWQFDSTDAGGDSRAHVNAETGNVVWHSVPVVNPGRGLSSFVNLTYNSQDRGGVLGSTLGRIPIVDAGDAGLAQDLPGLSYAEAGAGFSIAVSGPTRVNEPLGGVELAEVKDEAIDEGDLDGYFDYLQQDLGLPVDDTTKLGDQITLTDADGTVHTFQRGEGRKWIDPAGLDMHLRKWSDLPGTRLSPVEKKWAMTRPDGVTHFFDSLGYLRETKDRNGNTLCYRYQRFNAVTGEAGAPGEIVASCGPTPPPAPATPSVCAAKPIGELTDGAVCLMRLVDVIDPAGVEPEVGQGSTEQQARERSVRIEYRPGGLLPGAGTGGQLVDPPLESPIPFPGLVGGRAGRIAKVTDHAGEETAFDYDADGLLTQLTEAANRGADKRVTRFVWEPKDPGPTGDPLDDGVGQDRQLTAVVEINAEGGEQARTTLTYNDHPCNSAGGQSVCNLFPGVLREPRTAKKVTNRRGFTKDFSYNQRDDSTRTMDVSAEVAKATASAPAEFQKTTHRVDDRGRPIEITDALGRRTTLGWSNEHNRAARLVEAAGTSDEAVTAMDYNDNGLLRHQTTFPNGEDGDGSRTVELRYRDGTGRYTSMAAGVGDAAGRFVSDLTGIVNPKPGTGWILDPDAAGNVTRRVDAKGNAQQSVFDSLGRVESQTDEVGNLTRFEQFHATGEPGRVIGPRDGEGGQAGRHTWRYCYDKVGNVTRVTDPRGDDVACGSADDRPFSTRLTYDAFDRLETERVPLDSEGRDDEVPNFVSRPTGYDRNGNVTSSTDGEEHETRIDYTAMDQPQVVTRPGSQGPEITRYGYDGLDRLTRRTDPRNTSGTGDAFATEFELDQVGQRVAEIRHAPGQTPDRLTTSYAFDARGNVAGVNDPRRNRDKSLVAAIEAARPDNDPRFEYAYNDVDELIERLEQPSALDRTRGIKAARTKFKHDANGNREIVIAPRGFTEGPEDKFTTTNTYDHRDQLIAVKSPTGTTDGEATFARSEYVRRCDGRVIAETTPRGSENETTDPLTDCGNKTYPAKRYFTTRYDYNANGDLIERSIPFAPGQYGREAQVKDWKVAYKRDAVGNPTRITDAREYAFENEFFDTGALRSTERPSWWGLDWGQQGLDTPDPGERFSAGEADFDAQLATGGPTLSEQGGQSANAEGSDDSSELPDSEGEGNFAAVDPEALPEMLPKKGKTSFSYDREMRLKTIRDGAGEDLRERKIDYDPAGQVTEKRWPFQPNNPILHTFAYDRHGNLARSTVKDVDGVGDVSTTFDYDGLDRRVEERSEGARLSPDDPISREVSTLGYDPNGNLIERQTPRGTAQGSDGRYAFEFGYDSLDRLDREANPVGEEFTYAHDAAGNRTKATAPRGNAGESAPAGQSFDTKFEYDAAARLTQQTDGAGETSDFSYDADGNRTRVEAPGAGPGPGAAVRDRVTETVYDGRGLPWKETTGIDDGRDETQGDRRTTIREFDPTGNLRRLVNPKGVNGSGAEATPAHTDDGTDAETGNLKDATRHATVRLYDGDDLLTDVYMPWGDRLVERGSHGEDRQDANRYRQRFDRDTQGRIKNVHRPAALGDQSTPQVSYTYFKSDWVASTSDEKLTDPDSGQRIYSPLVTYDYDERGNQTLWETKNADESAKGRKVTRAFYPNGTLASRRAEKVKEDGTGDETTVRRYAYFYNGNRSLVRMDDNDPGRTSNPARTTTFSRDAAERELAINERWEKGKDSVLGYDEAGNVAVRRTDGRIPTGGGYGDSDGGRDDAKTTRFSYDVLDRETSMVVDQGGLHRETSRSYWPSGELREKTRQKSGSSDADYVTEQWDWSVHGETAHKRKQRHGSSQDTTDQAYAYDLNGNRTRDERGSHTFSARDQLIAWERSKKKPGTKVFYDLTPTGAIDRQIDTAKADGKQSVDFKFNGTRLTSSEDSESRTAFFYDDLGKVVRIKTEIKAANTVLPPVSQLPDTPQTCGELDADGKTTRYCYDEFERMVAARGPGLDGEKAVYTYDGLDRRDTKTVKTPTGDRVRDYGYVGTSRMLSREQDADGKTKYYDYGSDGEREGQAAASATTTDPSSYRTYEKDANGSVVALEEPDGSTRADNTYAYDPYGDLDAAGAGATEPEPEKQLGEAAKDNPFRFEGFYFDSGVKTYDMGARQYRPDSGRFLTQDRYESARGDLNLQADPLTQNRYAFAGGNPVSNVEFDGHCFFGLPCPKPLKRIGRRIKRAVTGFVNGISGGSTSASGGGSGRRGASPPPRRIASLSRTLPLLTSSGFTKRPPRKLRALEDLLPEGNTGDSLRGNLCGVGKGFFLGDRACFGDENTKAFREGAEAGELGTYFTPGGFATGVPRAGKSAFGVLKKLVPGGKTATKAGPCSFGGETRVLMADGSRKPISRIRVGDVVIATNPKTGKRSRRRVTRLWAHRDQVMDLSVGGLVITTTEDHPFWNQTDGEWQPAAGLGRGEHLRTVAGKVAHVEEIGPLTTRTAIAYNLTVAGAHTYHVSKLDLLVHNSNGCGIGAPKGGNKLDDIPFGPAEPRNPTQLRPPGVASNKEAWGPLWGRGADEARGMVGSKSADQLRGLGLDTATAQELSAFYRIAANRGRGAPTSSARADLMKHYADVLRAGE